MPADKPKYAVGYSPTAVERVRLVLLFIASKLGDLMDDIVVVGGLVPYLLVDQAKLPGSRRHVGTMDLDLGLSLAVLDDERYREISSRLRAEGFHPEEKMDGGTRRQTWSLGEGRERVTVDFLIQPNRQGATPGKLTQIEADFAAITVEGLELAFLGRREMILSGKLPNGSRITRRVWICGPGAFVVLKAMAFHLRGENKDAYDLFYMLREIPVDDIAAEILEFPRNQRTVVKAIGVLRDDFVTNDAGRVQAAEFITGVRDDGIEADVMAFVSNLISKISKRHII